MTEYKVIGEWLAVETDQCTCEGGHEFPHRSECGYEPIATITEIEKALAAVFAIRELIPKWERDGGAMSYESHGRAAWDLKKILDG